jgi:hypothetical protein
MFIVRKMQGFFANYYNSTLTNKKRLSLKYNETANNQQGIVFSITFVPYIPELNG